MILFHQQLLALLCLVVIVSNAVEAGDEYSGDDRQIRKPVNCKNIPDGNYVWGCSRFYSICTNGNEMPMRCYSNLVLNPDTNQCDHVAGVSICKSPENQEKLFRTKDPFSCSGKEDGLYEAGGCSNAYIECSRGQRYDRTCPINLVYHQRKQICDYSSKCRQRKPLLNHSKKPRAPPGMRRSGIEPTGNDPQKQEEYSVYDGFLSNPPSDDPGSPPAYIPPPDPPAPDPSPSSYKPYYEDQLPEPQAADPPTFDCSRKAEGIHIDPPGSCTDKFWKCANGRAFQFSCPTDLRYNAANDQCDYQKYVAACGGTPLTSSTPPPVSPPPKIHCSGKPDGYYPVGKENCSPQFVSCIAGYPTVMLCSGPLVFDKSTKECDYVGKCGKSKPTPPPSPPSENPQLDHGYSTNYYFGPKSSSFFGTDEPSSTVHNPYNEQPLPTPPAKPGKKFSCKGRTDGYYFNAPCSNSFYICGNGQANALTCPEDTGFDPKKRSCQYEVDCKKNNRGTDIPHPENESQSPSGFVELGPPSETPQVSNPVVLLPPTPLVPGPAEAYSNPPPPVHPSKFDCAKKADGSYAKIPCLPSFTYCVAEHPIPQRCPDPLLYHPVFKTCETKKNCNPHALKQYDQSPSNEG